MNSTIDYHTIVSKVETLVKSHMSKYDPSHDWLHVDRVRRVSLLIGRTYCQEGTPLDLEIIELAALLHDVCDAKYVTSDQAPSIINILIESGYPLERATTVERIVSRVGYRKELEYSKIQSTSPDPFRDNCIELHCVQDADKLDGMGGIGILRCAGFSGAKNIPLTDPHLDLPLTNTPTITGPHHSLGTAISHFHDKLLLLKDSIRTPKGLELAQERHNFMLSFLHQVELEHQQVL